MIREKEIVINSILLGNRRPLVLFAGPCIIEKEGVVRRTAERLKKITQKLNIPFVFKTSYDKANRTSVKSFRGPGIKKGLKILQRLKRDLSLPLLVDVHRPEDVWPAVEVADVLQIPAFLCRQTDLVLACASSGKPVNVKKGQFLSPYEIRYVVEKIESKGNSQIMLTERGTTFGYQNLVVDMRSLVIMKKTGYCLLYTSPSPRDLSTSRMPSSA